MDTPAAPKDTGLRNIIDKLAEFVARNGPEFESITKLKQQGNPRFSFLYGGDYYQYYQWRVASEQAMLKQQSSVGQGPAQMHQVQNNLGNNWNNPIVSVPSIQQQQPPAAISSIPNLSTVNVAREIENVVAQQNTLRDQIRQSEQNLSAQHGVLMQQQQKQIEEAVEKAQWDTVLKQAEENGLRLTEFDTILQPIIDSCTKDSISAGKNYILQHTGDATKCNSIMQYLLKKALVDGASFTQKLHLIYLVNDILHHCVRKRADDLKNDLENIVIPMFCSADLIATEEQKTKLLKLLSLWESKLNFFDACVISKLRSPNSSMQEYKTNLMNIHAATVSAIQQTTQTTFENYKQQHQAFTQHASQQIVILDTQKATLEQQQQQQQQNLMKQIPSLLHTPCDPINNPTAMNGNSMQIGGGVGVIGQATNPNMAMPGMNMNFLPQTQSRNNFPNDNNCYENFQNPEPPTTTIHSIAGISAQNASNSQASYQLPPPNFLIPDLSKPPPGFNLSAGSAVAATGPPIQIQPSVVALEQNPVVTPVVLPPQEEVKPNAPYYELPAGLMVPLIRLEDYSYRPLDPDEIRLPPAAPPSERLIGAIEAFYSLPSHERPRDGEGWEKLALYEYYKVKNAAKKIKEEEIQQGVRERSRSPSPIVIEVAKPKRIKKRSYRSRTRSRSRSKSPRAKSRSKSRSRSYSLSPKRTISTPVCKSPKPPKHSKKERERERRERSRSPPPSFGNFASKTANDFIEESNKGHQLLMKMGWGGSGTGLGAQGQGIEAPISGGEVRDRQSLYKGVGMQMNDPYENFRKNKGAAFISRMRSRDHERKKTNKNQPSQNSDEAPDY